MLKYEVKDVVCDYGVYENDELKLICNSRRNALLIADIMTADTQHNIFADPVNEPASPFPDGDTSILACACCGSGEYLHNEDGNRNRYCGQCGRAIYWGDENGKSWLNASLDELIDAAD